jgi:hypothetical protein
MIRIIHYALFVTLLSVAVPRASAQHGTWEEDTDALALNVIVYAGPGHYYHEDIFVRSGQQTIWFQTQPELSRRMDVRVGDGPWEVLNDDEYTLSFTPWENAPATPGEYRITVRDWGVGGSTARDIEYDLFVIPQASRGFSDNYGNTMVFWSGAGGNASDIDKPVLVVEGIDADNMNLHETYYALGSQLFGTGQARGADVIILNFANGGQDLRANADVLESAILYLNGIRTGTKELVVAGVSMGGVIARYALADMEARGVPHEASHFVSIDAPQQGATVDRELQDFIEDPPALVDPPEPANLKSVAGKQLLTYAAFDSSSPSLHTRFYNELNALNGDGYPHQTENVGVAFSTDDPNLDVGSQWLRVEMPFYDDRRFDIQHGSPEAKPGSYLPPEVTAFFGRAVLGLFGWNLNRSADPTFIPHDSALDIVNGQSKFDGDPITPDASTDHDEFDPDLVEPILSRIGFPEPAPPPLVADIDGPWGLARFETGTWTGSATGGVPGYSYRWAHRPLPEDPAACDAPPPVPDPDPPPCNPDKTGACTMGGGGIVVPMGPPVCEEFSPDVYGRTFSRSFGMADLYQLRLTVRDSGGNRSVDYMTVEVGGGGFIREGDPSSATAGEETTGSTASTRAGVQGEAAGVPEAVALEAYPNPVGSGQATGSATAVRFGLPAAADVALVVYDVLGREVARLAEGERAAGWHEARFDASALPSGRYVVRLVAGSVAETIPVTVLR